MKITQEKLKQHISYHSMTGILTRIKTSGVQKERWENKPAGWVTPNGYIMVRLLGRQVMAHRLAWLYMTGEWPKNDIDHFDRKKRPSQWLHL